jgi:CRP-like cAMP-binding protein
LSQLITFSEAEWEQLSAVVTTHQLRKGELFLQAPAVSQHLAFVNKGALRTFHLQDGMADVTFYFFFENSFATDYESFMTRRPTRFCIEAIEDSELLYLSYTDVQRLFIELREGQRLARQIAEGLYLALRQRAESLLLDTPEERYRQLLLTRSPILQRVNQYYVATYLGVQPQSLSRIRRRITLAS